MPTQRETVRRSTRSRAEQSRAVQLNQKKPEVRSEVCSFCSVVTETFGVSDCLELRSVIVTVTLKAL
jgi:hypothetical protein